MTEQQRSILALSKTETEFTEAKTTRFVVYFTSPQSKAIGHAIRKEFDRIIDTHQVFINQKHPKVTLQASPMMAPVQELVGKKLATMKGFGVPRDAVTPDWMPKVDEALRVINTDAVGGGGAQVVASLDLNITWRFFVYFWHPVWSHSVTWYAKALHGG